MTQCKINKAYPALLRLCDFRLPVKKAKDLYKLMKKASEHFEFATKEETKYVEEFGGKINPDGTVSFDSPEQYGKFVEKLSDLNNLTVDWSFEPITITEADIGEQQVSPSEINSLEGFVIFD